MSTERPRKLYRGIVLTYNQIKSFDFNGVLLPPNPPKIDSQGRKTVDDGNEYGVYMTDNQRMVYDVYGNVHSRGTVINRDIKIGYPPETINIPDIGISYEIDTNGIDVHKPWICQQLTGHYNNGFEGDEWIAESIPKANYQITRIRIGKDILHHDCQDLELEGINDYTSEIKKVIETRKQQLEDFIKGIAKMPESKRRSFGYDERKIFEEIYGDDGLKYINEGELDVSSADQALKYLMAKVYKENTENIDITTLKYLKTMKQKLARSKEPKDIDNLKQMIHENILEVEEKRQAFILRKEKEGEIANTGIFNSKISMMNGIIQKLDSKMNLQGTKTKLAQVLEQEHPLEDTKEVISVFDLGKQTIEQQKNVAGKQELEAIEAELIRTRSEFKTNRRQRGVGGKEHGYRRLPNCV